MSYRTHLLAVPEFQAADLCFNEDYCILGGVTRLGVTLPVMMPPEHFEYLVPAGVQGLPYLAELGRLGGRIVAGFPEPVVAVIVVTSSVNTPVLVPLYVPPPVVIKSVEAIGLTVLVGVGTPQPVYRLTMSDGQVLTYTRTRRYGAPSPGLAFNDFDSASLYEYTGPITPAAPTTHAEPQS